MRYLVAVIFVTAIHTTSFAQIVNVENLRMQSDTTGWMGNIGTGFRFEKNATKVISINVNAHVEYKTKKSLYLFLINYNLLKGNNQTFNDNIFYHLRYNYKINKWLRWEAFTQLQHNNVTGIQSRLLAGTGPRFKLSGGRRFALYGGAAVMYENEKEKTVPPVIHRDLRGNSYVSCTYKPSDNSEITGTVFYQPLFKDFSDYRVLNEISIKFRFIKHFSFTTSWYYLYDSKPATSFPKLNYSISNGIEFEF